VVSTREAKWHFEVSVPNVLRFLREYPSVVLGVSIERWVGAAICICLSIFAGSLVTLQNKKRKSSKSTCPNRVVAEKDSGLSTTNMKRALFAL
jgi:hypothetical protein